MNVFDDVVRDLDGVIVAGAKVYIYGQDGTLADLFAADLVTPLKNPLTSDDKGQVKAWLADDGYYTAEYFWGGRKRFVRANILLGIGPIEQTQDIAAQSALILEILNAIALGVAYADTATGIAGTEDQEYFGVISGQRAYVYLNNAGVAELLYEFATVAVMNALFAKLADLASTSTGKGAALIGVSSGGTVDTALITPNVKQFGAVGGNATNDSPGIQAAVTNGGVFTIPSGTYRCDTAITGNVRAVSFGATFTGANPLDGAYPTFGPGALRVIARGSFDNAIIGIAHNTAPAATTTFPTGITGYGRNDNAGNHVFGVYAEARQHATTGVATNEIDSFNMTGTAPSSNLPPSLGIGTTQNHPIGLQVGAGGTANSSIGIHICQEGSLPQKFLTGIYMNPAALVNYGLFIDAVAGSTFVPAVIKHGVGATGLQLQGVGTPVSANAAFVYFDGAAAERFAIKQDGKVFISATQVLSNRDTGWTAMTGTPDKATTYATGTVTLAQLAGRVAALQAALTAHGLIGA